ncbi:MAG: fibronectin type III domain-containing protein [Candidatus Acidiferrales bacterium]
MKKLSFLFLLLLTLLWCWTTSAQTETTTTGIKLTWTQGVVSKSACPVILNKIYRGTASGKETYYADHKAETSYFMNGGHLVPGTTYYYQVTAVNCDGVESGRSKEIKATWPATAEYTYAEDK